jgi:hypothetical protein
MTSTTSTADVGDISERQVEREERLVRVLSRARGHMQLAISETWLFTLGGVFITLGLALVVVGWIGASRTVLVAGQIPYLISGGLLGLAFVFLGGFLYFGYWLAMLVRDGRERAEDDQAERAALRASVDEMTRTLASVAERLGNAPAPRPRKRA